MNTLSTAGRCKWALPHCIVEGVFSHVSISCFCRSDLLLLPTHQNLLVKSVQVCPSLSAVVCVCLLTQLLQGRDPVFVSVVLSDGGDTATHQGVRQGLHRHLRRIQSTDQGLETLVGERRLPAIQLYDPGEGQRQGLVSYLRWNLLFARVKQETMTMAQKQKPTFLLQKVVHLKRNIFCVSYSMVVKVFLILKSDIAQDKSIIVKRDHFLLL